MPPQTTRDTQKHTKNNNTRCFQRFSQICDYFGGYACKIYITELVNSVYKGINPPKSHLQGVQHQSPCKLIYKGLSINPLVNLFTRGLAHTPLVNTTSLQGFTRRIVNHLVNAFTRGLLQTSFLMVCTKFARGMCAKPLANKFTRGLMLSPL